MYEKRLFEIFGGSKDTAFHFHLFSIVGAGMAMEPNRLVSQGHSGWRSVQFVLVLRGDHP